MGIPDLFSVAGGTVIVTGAASGIGYSTAMLFGAAGAKVVAVDLDEAGTAATAEAVRSAGGEAIHVQVDVALPSSVEQMTTKAHEHFGQIDYLINSAGVTRRFPAVDFPLAEWDRIIAINLTGSFLCAQAAGRLMVARGHGRIVNIASIAGVAGFPDTVAYQSSKGGQVQMTRALASEWGKHGITVNAIAPGVVMTPMQKKLRKENPAKFDTFLSRMAISTPSEPEDIAAAALFLCSPAASLITGHVLPVDGGYLAL